MPAANVPTELSMTLTLSGGRTVGRLGFGAMRVTGPGRGDPRVTRLRRSLCCGGSSTRA